MSVKEHAQVDEVKQDIARDCSPRVRPGAARDGNDGPSPRYMPEIIFSNACLRGLMLSRSSLLSKMVTGRTILWGQLDQAPAKPSVHSGSTPWRT